MKKIKVYIASPYTKPEGQQLENTIKSFKIFNILANKGFIPFVPLTSHFIHEKYPQDYKFWIDYDLEWVLCCDCLLRIKGESSGADGEVEVAKKNNIPVFYIIQDLIEWRDKKE
jgi:hypothetical protein